MVKLYGNQLPLHLQLREAPQAVVGKPQADTGAELETIVGSTATLRSASLTGDFARFELALSSITTLSWCFLFNLLLELSCTPDLKGTGAYFGKMDASPPVACMQSENVTNVFNRVSTNSETYMEFEYRRSGKRDLV